MPKRHEFKSEAEWLEHLRIWFAGMVMPALLRVRASLDEDDTMSYSFAASCGTGENIDLHRPTEEGGHKYEWSEYFAIEALEYADAMIKELT